MTQCTEYNIAHDQVKPLVVHSAVEDNQVYLAVLSMQLSSLNMFLGTNLIIVNVVFNNACHY